MTAEVVLVSREMHWLLDYTLDLDIWRFEQVKIELSKYHKRQNSTTTDVETI